MPQTDTEELSMYELDINMLVVLPDGHHRDQHAGQTVRISDYTEVGEYLEDGMVYAYADPDTGEHLGLLNASLLPNGSATTVDVVGHAQD